MRDYVARRRPEIAEEEGRGPARVFIPRHHPPGQHAEVDFGELWVRLAGVMTSLPVRLRMSYSGKAVHRVFATCGQEAFRKGTCTRSPCWVLPTIMFRPMRFRFSTHNLA